MIVDKDIGNMTAFFGATEIEIRRCLIVGRRAKNTSSQGAGTDNSQEKMI